MAIDKAIHIELETSKIDYKRITLLMPEWWVAFMILVDFALTVCAPWAHLAEKSKKEEEHPAPPPHLSTSIQSITLCTGLSVVDTERSPPLINRGI